MGDTKLPENGSALTICPSMKLNRVNKYFLWRDIFDKERETQHLIKLPGMKRALSFTYL